MDGTKILYTILIAFVGFLLLVGFTPTITTNIALSKATCSSALGNITADILVMITPALPYLFLLGIVISVLFATFKHKR